MKDDRSVRQAWVVLSACAVLTLTAIVLVAPMLWSGVLGVIEDIAKDAKQPVWHPEDQPVALEDQPPIAMADRTANPGLWVSDRDYPIEAIRNEEQGRVAVAIDFDASGRPVACRVTSVSGSAVLDRTTCELVMARGRAEPAARGHTRTLAFRWVLPE